MYRQILTADEWYFVTRDATSGAPSVLKLAAWALLDGSATVIGLVGNVRGGGMCCASSSHRNMATLVTVPPLEGQYKHLSDLFDDELSVVAAKNTAGC